MSCAYPSHLLFCLCFFVATNLLGAFNTSPYVRSNSITIYHLNDSGVDIQHNRKNVYGRLLDTCQPFNLPPAATFFMFIRLPRRAPRLVCIL